MALYLGLDIGGTKSAAVVGDKHGMVLVRVSARTPQGSWQPVRLENDATANALAEHRWGAGRGCADMAFLTMGTGIGEGLILNGELYRGRGDLAGEIGYATVWARR